MTCEVCGERVETSLVLDHLRLFHPEWGGLECWPDGDAVVEDETLTPEDFT